MSELEQVRVVLEAHYRDMQDLEFTIDRGELYILQTRTGKRTGRAAMRIAVAMVDEGLIDVPTAILRVEPSAVEELLHPAVDASGDAEELVRGLPASPGAGVGRLVFSAAAARAWASRGERVVLVTDETSADDFDGMEAAEGVLTARGGMTSHAAVVARGMGKCCVVGAGALHVDEEATRLKVGDVTLEEGEWVTLDGTTGRVFRGRLPTVDVGLDDAFWRLMDWADEARRLGVRANADTPEDAAHARELGAEGIGLCRTEYMFFGAARLAAMRTMILAPDESERREALELLLPMQRADFEGLFRAMAGYPVTIRLLDPPFHELLPDEAEEIAELAAASRHSLEEMEEGVAHHREDNPMLGHRGVRLAITYPEVTEMQARAVFEAALAVYAEGVDVRPEIMVPLVAVPGELTEQIAIIDRVAAGLFKEAGHTIPYLIGTMIELPRAALVAEELARHADFFSFGTNDLTQTTLGMSRDDSGTFLPTYLERGILRADPFRTLDQEGVGRLVRLAVTEGRSAQPGLTMGICGEHGADPSSVEFFHRAGLDYVSCSPFRVPVARISAAQAALRASMVERRARTRRPYA